jgi:hypothetical protein
MDYCSTHPESTMWYYASDMQIKIHSDTMYLSEPNAKLRIGGHLYLGNKQIQQPHPLPMAHSFAIKQCSNTWFLQSLKLSLTQSLSMLKRAMSRALLIYATELSPSQCEDTQLHMCAMDAHTPVHTKRATRILM